MVLGKDKLYILKVWGNSTTPSRYDVKGRPLLGSPTNDVAVVFEKPNGKEIIVSSNCRWILEEK